MIIPKFIIDQSIINSELKNLNNILNQQRQLKTTLLIYLEKVSEGVYNASDINDSNSLISCLESIQKSFDNIKENINRILDLKKFLTNMLESEYINTFDFDKYNQDYAEIFAKISEDNIFYYSFMESLLKYMNLDLPNDNFEEIHKSLEIKSVSKIKELQKSSYFDVQKNESKENANSQYEDKSNNTNTNNITSDNIVYVNIVNEEGNQTKDENTSSEENISVDNSDQEINQEEDNNFFEKTLILSEKDKKAILPFTTSEIIECYSKNPDKYKSLQDLIDKEYTVSFSNYTNPVKSRFKEIFNLAKNKSDMPLFKAYSIARKLKNKNDLNPAVVTACTNINELNNYLYYLENNDLEHFYFFRIIYE